MRSETADTSAAVGLLWFRLSARYRLSAAGSASGASDVTRFHQPATRRKREREDGNAEVGEHGVEAIWRDRSTLARIRVSSRQGGARLARGLTEPIRRPGDQSGGIWHGMDMVFIAHGMRMPSMPRRQSC